MANSEDVEKDESFKMEPTGATEDDLGFMAGLKKKKKKKVVDFEDFEEKPSDGGSGSATPAPAPIEDDNAVVDEDNMDFTAGLKKKKKKKAVNIDDAAKAFDAELEEAGASSNKEKSLDDDEGVDNDEGAELDDDDEADDLGDEDDLFDREGEADAEVDTTAVEMTWLGSDRDYTYKELLKRIFGIIRAVNPDADLKGMKRIPPPQVFREGNKKTVFANLTEIARKVKRNPEHVVQFMFAELGTSGSVDGSSRLVIKGRFQAKQLENVLRRYIMEYVTCKTCKSTDTVLSKENRIYFMDCEKCGSRRSVSAIKTGYRANLQKRRLRTAAS